MDYERLKNLFTPEAIEVIRQHEREYETLDWSMRQKMGLLRGYPKNTQSAAFQTADKHNDHGWACHRAAQYREALEHYKPALQLCPDFAMVWNNKGLAHFRLGQFEDARAAYLEAIRLAPAFIAPYSNLGILHFELRADKKEALTWFRKSLALDPNYQRSLEYVRRIEAS